MPIKNVIQPTIIAVSDTVRLRKFALTLSNFQMALPWYQDIETVYAVDGIKEPYDMEKLQRMYHYLNERGELYFIELRTHGTFQPIGDVTFWEFDMPIVIGPIACRRKGIGKSVIEALIDRGKALNYGTLYVGEIYKDNLASQSAFEGAGFVRYKETEKGYQYCLNLEDS